MPAANAGGGYGLQLLGGRAGSVAGAASVEAEAYCRTSIDSERLEGKQEPEWSDE